MGEADTDGRGDGTAACFRAGAEEAGACERIAPCGAAGTPPGSPLGHSSHSRSTPAATPPACAYT
ncbi:hypothetical protein, partial [Streptomyces sp. CC77]|uniref:hypothetical protein n=1 Tax=Streptomyces sp. CC77 TaxID=1906739 RepID=UPI0020C8E3AC